MLINMELCWVLLVIVLEMEKILLEYLSSDFNFIMQVLLEINEVVIDGSLMYDGILLGEVSNVINGKSIVILVQYIMDLIVLVCEGKIDLVLGCNYEISMMVDILLCC